MKTGLTITGTIILGFLLGYFIFWLAVKLLVWALGLFGLVIVLSNIQIFGLFIILTIVKALFGKD